MINNSKTLETAIKKDCFFLHSTPFDKTVYKVEMKKELKM